MIKIVLSLLICFTYLSGQAQKLTELKELAAANNPRLKAYYFEFKAALSKAAQVNSLPDPNLSFAYFISPVETRVGPQKARASLAQQFPWFGTLKSKENIEKLKAEAVFQKFLNEKYQTFTAIELTYYPLAEIADHLRLQREYLKFLNTFHELAISRNQNNSGSLVDVLRVEIKINEAKTNLRILEKSRKPLISKLKELCGSKQIESSFEFKEFQKSEMPDTAHIRKLLLEHPNLKSISAMEQSFGARKELATKQGLPNFALSINYVLVENRADAKPGDNGKDAFFPSLNLSLPLYRSKYKSDVKEAELNQSALQQERLHEVDRLNRRLDEVLFAVYRSNELYELYNDQIKTSEKAYSLLETAYANEREEIEEVLRMLQQVIMFKMKKASAIAHFNSSLADLNYLTSKVEDYEIQNK